jgi:hypothetical protein
MNRRNFLKNTIATSIGMSLLPITGFSQIKPFDYASIPNPIVTVSFVNSSNKQSEKVHIANVYKVFSLRDFIDRSKDSIVFIYRYEEDTFGGISSRFVTAFKIHKEDIRDVSSIRINGNPVTFKTLK